MRTNRVIVAILLPVALAWVLLRAAARMIARASVWLLGRLDSALRGLWTLIESPVRRVADAMARVMRAIVRVGTPAFRLLVRGIGDGLRFVRRCIVAGWKLLRPAAVVVWRGILNLSRLVGPSFMRAIRIAALAATTIGVFVVHGTVRLLGGPLEVALGIVINLVRPLAAALATASGAVIDAFSAALAALRAVVGRNGPAGRGRHATAAAGGGTAADRRLTATFLAHALLASVLLGLVGLVRDAQPGGGGAMALLAFVTVIQASGSVPHRQYGRALAAFLVAAVALGITTTPAPAVARDPVGAALGFAVPGFLLFLAGGVMGWIGDDELAKIQASEEAQEARRAGSEA